MKFELAKQKDLESVKSLWKYCFSDSDEYIKYYFENIYNKENNYVVKDETNNVVTSLMTNKYNIKLVNNIEQISYIVGVSSQPQNRGNGYASFLIKQTLKELYKKNETVTMLMPIDTDIYTRYGFANVFDMQEMDLSLENIKKYKSEDYIIKEATKDNIEQLIKIYEKYQKQLGFSFIRDKAYYENVFDEIYLDFGNIYICYDMDNNAIGYMIFYPKFQINKTAWLREIICNDISSYKTFLNMIKSHFTQFKNVLINVDNESYLPCLLNNDNKIKYTKKPFIMSRIINVKKVFEDILKNKKISYNFILTLKVNDDIIDENNGVFVINDNKLSISKNQNFDLQIDIGELTQLYFGYLSLENFAFSKGLDITDTDIIKLSEIFSRKNNYFNDYV